MKVDNNRKSVAFHVSIYTAERESSVRMTCFLSPLPRLFWEPPFSALALCASVAVWPGLVAPATMLHLKIKTTQRPWDSPGYRVLSEFLHETRWIRKVGEGKHPEAVFLFIYFTVFDETKHIVRQRCEQATAGMIYSRSHSSVNLHFPLELCGIL